MQALALDIGEVRVGIAASDASGHLAFPIKVLPAHEVLNGAPSFMRIVQDHEPDVLVVGRPLTLAGQRGPQASHIEDVAHTIANKLELPLEFVDERLSSQEAKRILREEGKTEKEMRGSVDMIAASLFLQTWLDSSLIERS